MKTYIPHTIRIRISNARQVAIVGDFNNWHSNAHPLVEVAEGLWERIVDLPAGKHRYAFFVIDDIPYAVRSRVVGNGSVLWVPENPEQSLSVSAHPSLSIQRAEEPEMALVA
jgi:1,4-alpha-glucan branching enzyme